MQINAIDEYNSNGHLIYADKFIGAYVRGKTQKEALEKFAHELLQYCSWLGIKLEDSDCYVSIIQEKISELQICDADSDILFDSEIPPLTENEYCNLKYIALKSAKDFLALYNSIPNKTSAILPPRKTFYGNVPLTAQEMYEHTKNVNEYYFHEIGVSAENEPDIYTCRLQAFAALESKPDFLNNTVHNGSYGEQWSLRKVCRRFIWHDRIHAKAMYRMAVKLCGEASIDNTFKFIL